MGMIRAAQAVAIAVAVGFASQGFGSGSGWDFSFTAGEGYTQDASPTNYNESAGAIGEWTIGNDDASLIEAEALTLDTGAEPLTWTPDDAYTSTGKIVTIQQDVTFVAVPDGETPSDTTGAQTGVYLQEEIDGEITTNVLMGLVSGGWMELSATGLSVTNHSTHTVKFVINYSAEPDATVSFFVGETLMTIGSGPDTAMALNTAATAISAVLLQGSGTIDNFSGTYAPLHTTHDYSVTNYTWAADNSTCTATNACECGDVAVTETVATTYVVTTQPTIGADGEGTYTAAFVNFPLQTKTVTIDQLPGSTTVILMVYNAEGNVTSLTPYDTLAGAFANAASNNVIKLLQNHRLVADLTVGAPDVTLDLNGFTLSFLNADGNDQDIYKISIPVTSSLAITDTNDRDAIGRILIPNLSGIAAEGPVSLDGTFYTVSYELIDSTPTAYVMYGGSNALFNIAAGGSISIQTNGIVSGGGSVRTTATITGKITLAPAYAYDTATGLFDANVLVRSNHEIQDGDVVTVVTGSANKLTVDKGATLTVFDTGTLNATATQIAGAASVDFDSQVTYYGTFADAVDAANSTEIIKLLQSVPYVYTFSVGQTMRVNLNAKTFSKSAPYGYAVQPSSEKIDGVTIYTYTCGDPITTLSYEVSGITTNRYFGTLSEAFNALTTGQTNRKITLNADTTEERTTLGSGSDKNVPVLLDLGGHTYASTYVGTTYGAILVWQGCTLTISNGTMTTLPGSYAAVYVRGGATVNLDATLTINAQNDGVVVLENGSTVNSAANITSAWNFGITGIGLAKWAGTVVNVTGGSITAGGWGIYNPQNGALNISGGTISASNAVSVKSGPIAITGGTLNGITTALEIENNTNYVDNLSVAVSGGSFTGAVTSVATEPGRVPLAGFITGGTYSIEPTAAHIATGYEAVQEGDVWVIQKIVVPTTMIIVAGNKGSATVNGEVPETYYLGDEVVITPSNGYVIAQISVGGSAVAGTLGLASFTTNLTADGITATFAKEDAWWVDPGIFKKINELDGYFPGSQNLSQFGLSETKGYLASSRSPGASDSQAVMYRLADLNAAIPDTLNYVSKSVNNGIYFDEPSAMANRSVTFMGDYLVGGNILATVDWSLGHQLPDSGVPFTWQDSANGVVKMTASDGVGLTFMYQAPDGAVYATTYKGTKLGRYTLAGTTLTLDTSWGAAGYVTLPDGSYAVAGAVIGGQTNLYVCTDTQGVFVVNAGAATPEATLLLARTVTGRTQNMCVSGTADGTPRLIVVDAGDNDAIKVFDLTDDGMSLCSTTPAATHAVADLGGAAKGGYSPMTGTDDDMYGYLANSISTGDSPYLMTLRHTDYCPTTATQTVGANGSSTVKSTTIYVYPDVNNSVTYTGAAGYRIASLTTNSTAVPAATGAASYELENIATDDEIVVAFEQIPLNVSQALVGDVISSVAAEVAEVSAGGSFEATYTATNGWISSVYTNGAPALDCSAKPTEVTLTLSNIARDFNIVVATSKTKTAPANKWYENPGVVATNATLDAVGDAGPYHIGMDADGDYVGASVSFQYNGSPLYAFEALAAGNASPINTVMYSGVSSVGTTIRGAAVSKVLNVQLLGTYTGTNVVSAPLNKSSPVLGTDMFVIANDQGVAMDSMAFTADGQYLFSTACAGGNNKAIYKWKVHNGLKSSGINLTLEAGFPIATSARIRHFAYARIGGKDLVYCLLDGTTGVAVVNATDGTVTTILNSLPSSANYGGIVVSGVAKATPHITVLSSYAEHLEVYALAGDGLSASSQSPVASFTKSDLEAAGAAINNYGMAILSSDDEGTLLFGCRTGAGLTSKIFALQYVAPSYPSWILDCGLTGAALEAMQGKYDTWAAWQTVTDLMTTDYGAQFLMNADAAKNVALEITGIAVDAAGNVTLSIMGTADEATIDLATINGVFYLSTTTELGGTWSGKTFGTVSSNIGVDGIAVPEFAGSNGLFFKAEVDYAAPAGSTELTAPAE